MTRSPVLKPLQHAPACSTVPATSWPSTVGGVKRFLPSTTFRSVWQTPHEATLIRISSSSTLGSSRSSILKGWRASYSTAAFITAPILRRTDSWPSPRPERMKYDGKMSPRHIALLGDSVQTDHPEEAAPACRIEGYAHCATRLTLVCRIPRIKI